ncbi:MAG: ABC transporter substrate-binding protein [Owenweeksia sp.]|nr:ABC transporter substrate-binding protein [Owenweeksia sp.]|tara:strand:+ start:9882 stop:10757 length:876 start_codon:yes stop_codon:yes gene_type:complete
MALSACGRFANEENTLSATGEKTDTTGQRIICLAKQYNEIMYALGAEKNLVAVDLSSTYPPEIRELTTVGYHRALSAEGILSMKPDLIIHDNNVGPEHVMRQLEELKIPMKTFGDYEQDIAGTQKLMREMGAYFGKEDKAEELSNRLEKDMDKALEGRKAYSDTPKVVVIHFGRASNIYLTVTRASTAGKMIEWAGGEIAIDGERGMRHLSSPELIAQANPDVILLTDFGYDRLGSQQKIEELPGVSGTNAARNERIYRVEEHDLIYLGPRTGKNVLKLRELIHRTGHEES